MFHDSICNVIFHTIKKQKQQQKSPTKQHQTNKITQFIGLFEFYIECCFNLLFPTSCHCAQILSMCLPHLYIYFLFICYYFFKFNLGISFNAHYCMMPRVGCTNSQACPDRNWQRGLFHPLYLSQKSDAIREQLGRYAKFELNQELNGDLLHQRQTLNNCTICSGIFKKKNVTIATPCVFNYLLRHLVSHCLHHITSLQWCLLIITSCL